MTALPTALVAVGLALVAGGAAAQVPPDVSGRWVLVEATGVTEGWEVADAVTIRPVEAPPPHGNDLDIERRRGDQVRVETLTVGLAGGTVGGVTAAGAPLSSFVKSEWAVRWRDGVLLQWSSETTRDADGIERVSERAQEWSIDADGRLVMALRTRAPGEESRRGRLVYRRLP